MPSIAELGTRVAEATKKAMANQKAETVAELKALIPQLIADLAGTGTPGFKALQEAITKDVLQRVPQGSMFLPDRGKSLDPRMGFEGMGQKAVDDLARRVLFAVTPRSLQSDLFISERNRLFAGVDAKAMSVAVGSAGGFTLPEEFIAEVARKLVHISTFLGSCRVWSGVEMQGKMSRETGTVSVTIAGELVSPANTQPAFGNITWSLQKRMALTNLPMELWKFSGIDVLNLLATMFAEQFQKTEDLLYLTGTGSQQPMGLLTQQTGMNTLAIGSTKTQWQDLIKTKHSIKSQYRVERANCVFMMNNDTIEGVSTLTDDQNRPVFIDRGSEGMGGPNIPPQTIGFIAGYPVLENPYMPGPVTEGTVQTTSYVVFSNLMRGYYAFKGPNMEVKTSDVAYDAFLNDGLYTKATDFIDGKPAIPEATAILSGVIF